MSATTATNAIVLPADTLLDKAIAVVLWWLGLCWLVPVMTVMMVLAFIVHPEKTEWLSRLYCRGQIFVTGSRWRAEVDPAVDPQATYLFAQNHINLLDHVTMYPATPHFKQGIELESHFKIPIYGWFMKQRGTLAVRRGDRRALSKLKEGFAAEVARGHSLLVFPEGTRTTTGRVGRFRSGTLRMARDLGVPVVPVAVTGMYEVLRKGSWLLRPGRTVTVHVLAPIPTKGLSDAEIDEVAAIAQSRISEKVDTYWTNLARGSS